MPSTEGLELLGTGSFSRAYLTATGRVLLKTADIPKEAMADSLFPKHRLFPEVNLVGTEGTKNLYDMPRYNQPRIVDYEKALTPRQYRLYRRLTSISYRCYPDSPEGVLKAFESISSEFKKEKEAIIEAWNFIRQFSPKDKVGFEMCPVNLAVKGGKLILLDSFFTWESPKRNED